MNEEHRRKLSESHKGKHHSAETLKKLSDSHRGKKYTPMSIEAKSNLSRTHKGINKGRIMSEETRRKMRQNHKGFSGKHQTQTIREQISATMSGSKSHLWRGGISIEPYTVDWTKTLRRSIRERDRFTCQICFSDGNSVHHIDYNKFNSNPTNLITLCRNCHSKTNHNRLAWKSLLTKRINKINRINTP